LVSVLEASRVSDDRSQAAPGLAGIFLQSAARDDRDLLSPRFLSFYERSFLK
jgi:hypothetical protein